MIGWLNMDRGAASNARQAVVDLRAAIRERRLLQPATAKNGSRRNDGGFLLLSANQCRDLLTDHEIGRLAFVANGVTPVIVPVNYIYDGTHILIGSGPGPKLLAAERHGLVAFEVDDFDRSRRAGWSVVVNGSARVLDGDGHHRALPDSWVPGERTHVIEITPLTISGRQLRPGPRPGDVEAHEEHAR